MNRTTILLCCFFTTLPMLAQDGLRSVDVVAALTSFVTAVKQANATDASSAAKQLAAGQAITNLLARITATNATTEEQFSAHAQALEVSADAALDRLAAARRTATLLHGAQEPLAGARRSLGFGTSAQTPAALPNSADTRVTDASLADFTSAGGRAALDKAEENLRSFQARTKHEVVRIEVVLGRLEIQATRGLAGVGGSNPCPATPSTPNSASGWEANVAAHYSAITAKIRKERAK